MDLEKTEIEKIFSIKEIINVDIIQNIQDFLSNTIEISSQCFVENGPLTKVTNLTDFCDIYMHESKSCCQRCENCLKNWIKDAANVDKPIIS